MKLKPVLERKALQDHVITSLMVKRESSCLAHCYEEQNCISYNLGPALVNGSHQCELSNSDHLQHSVYQSIEVRVELGIFPFRCNSTLAREKFEMRPDSILFSHTITVPFWFSGVSSENLRHDMDAHEKLAILFYFISFIARSLRK